jgi:hypothetical protein
VSVRLTRDKSKSISWTPSSPDGRCEVPVGHESTFGKVPPTTLRFSQNFRLSSPIAAKYQKRSRARRLPVQFRIVSRGRFVPLSFGAKCCWTSAKPLASSTYFSFPESSDRGPGFGHRDVHAECGCGVADDLTHDESNVCRADSNGPSWWMCRMSLPRLSSLKRTAKDFRRLADGDMRCSITKPHRTGSRQIPVPRTAETRAIRP